MQKAMKMKVLQENILNTICSFFTVTGIKQILIKNLTNIDALVILSSSWFAKYFVFGVTSMSIMKYFLYVKYKVNKMGSL